MKKASLLVLAVFVACADRELVGPTAGSPNTQVSDAVHNSGNAHFYFLPPLVPAPSVTGAFDASLDPVVRICEWEGSGCGALLAEFTTTSGSGSETVRLVAEDEHYIVNWHTDRFPLDASKSYRLRVLAAETELGFADIDVVDGGRDLRNVQTGEYLALVNGRTLPVVFRIEHGAVFVVGETGATFNAQGGQVSVTIPPDAVANAIGITVVPTTDVPFDPGLVPGTTFEFGPSGTVFDAPAHVSIGYDPALLPVGVEEASLRLHTVVAGEWVEVPDGGVDPAARRVTGLVSHFSPFGVAQGRRVASVSVAPASATASVGCSVQFTGIPRDASGNVLSVPVTWSSSNTGVAHVTQSGLVTGVAPGSATITGSSQGRSATSTMTVTAATAGSGTLCIEVDATGLSVPQFDVGGVGAFSTASRVGLRVTEGPHAIGASEGIAHFTVDAAGTVDYDAALNGVLSGRGTATLVVRGAAITIDGTALSAPQMDLGGVGNFPTSTPVTLHLLPNIGTFPTGRSVYGLAASEGIVYPSVRPDGTVDYPTEYDGVLSGRGTATLVVRGAAITIDATALSAPQFDVGGVGNFPTNTPVTLRLLPNIGTFPTGRSVYGLAASEGIVYPSVRPDGTVDYPTEYDGVLSGQGTATLVVRGAAITIDGTALSAPQMDLGGVGNFPTSTPVTLHLLPNVGTFPGARSVYGLGASEGIVYPSVRLDGTVDFAAGYDGVLSGRGTATLVVRGAAITIDGTALSAPQMDLGGVGNFPTSTPVTLHLLPNVGTFPGARSVYGLGASEGIVYPSVRPDGTVDFAAGYDGVLSGRGTATLVVRGAAITIDATALTAASFSIGGIGTFLTAAFVNLRLLPNGDALYPYGFRSTALDFEFVVTFAGVLEYDPSLDGSLSGRGTTLLTVSVPVPLTWMREYQAPSPLNAIWGASSTNIVAVGGDGMILEFDGVSWRQQTSPVTRELLAVWGSGGTVFAVGEFGTLLTRVGGAWTLHASPTCSHVTSVWGASTTDVYAVAFGSGRVVDLSTGAVLCDEFGSRVLHYDGIGWSTVLVDTTVILGAVWGTAAADVSVFGHGFHDRDLDGRWDDPMVLQFDGSSWARQSGVGPTEPIAAIWSHSSTESYGLAAAGDAILKDDGSAWSYLPAAFGTCVQLRAIGGSGPRDLHVVGGDRCTHRPVGFHYDGTTWTLTLNPPLTSTEVKTIEFFTGVWAGSRDSVFAVGNSGEVYRGSR